MPEANQDRSIGRLEGKLDAIIAAQSKADTKLENLSTQASKIDRIEERVARIEPMANEFNRWRERGIGALMLISMVSALLGAVISSAWQKIVAVFTG